MPKRKRHRAGSPDPPGESDAEQAVRLFAERQRDQEQARRAAKREAKEAKAVAQRRAARVRAKDEAAGRLKAVRGSGAGGEAIAAAEADYRSALDAVLADESGIADGPAPDGPAEPVIDEPADAEPADAAE